MWSRPSPVSSSLASPRSPTGLNFIVSIHRLRAPGMTWYRMPVFLWSLYATSVILVLATPVLAMTLLLLVVRAVFRIGVFDPALGGDPLLFQHLFWFYSHPAVYIMILPGFGVVSEIIPVFSRKRIFGYNFIVWSQHRDRGDQLSRLGPPHVRGRHIALLRAGVLVLSFTGCGALRDQSVQLDRHDAQGFIRFDAPMLYALGFIGLFTMGGLTGLFVAALAADVHLHETYFVVAHFHYVMVGGMVIGLLRRLALLVAEDHRPDVSGDVGPRRAR